MAVTPGAAKGTIKRKRTSKSGVTVGDGDLDFRAIADTSLNGIIVFQGEPIVYVNPAATDMVGYSKDELLCMKFWEVMHPDFQDIARAYGFGKLRGEQAESRIEIKVVRKDGEERWVDAFSSCIEYNGRPAVLVTAVDITERKRAEETLNKLRVNLEKSQEIAHLGSWELDLLNNRLAWSDEAYRIFGLRPQEFGATYEAFLAVVHPDDREAVDAAYSRSIQGGQDTYEFEHRIVRQSTGEVRFVHEKCEHFRDESGRINRSVGMVQDITERKRAEEALRESERKYRNIVEQVNDWVWEIDGRCRYTYASPRARELLGYEIDEIIGRTPFDFMPPGEVERVRKLFGPAFEGHEAFSLLENTLVRKDGGRVIVETSGTPMFDDRGAFLGYRGIDRDISERKRTEEALAFERSQLLSIFDSIDDVVYVTDPYTYEVLYANKAMREMFGGDLVGGICYREFQRRNSPCDFCTNPIILKEKGKPYRWEYYNPTVDRYFMITDRIIKWPDGRDVRFEIARDITERKRAEEAVKFANAYNRSLIEASLDPLVTIAPDGKITDVNAATEAVTGCSREKLIGTDFSDYFTDSAKAHEGYRKVFEEGSVTDYPLEIRRKDGHITPVLYNATVYRDETGEVIGVFAAARDVTERKQAEEALRESEAMLNSIFRSAPTGIGVVVDRVIVAVNDKLCLMTGYSRDELLGKNARLFYPSDEEYEYVGKVKYGMITERGTGEVETCWRHKDGTFIDILLSSSPIVPEDWSAGVTFTALDITKRKRAEDEVKEARSQAELYLDLMGHDINNMHQIALGYLEMARDMHPETGQGELLDKPIEVLQRSARLIRNVRKLQKLRDGLFQTELVDLCQLLVDVQKEFGAVPRKAVTLNLNGHEHCHVRANELLHDVFANLVSNAIKHTGDRADIIIDLDVVWNGGRQYCRVMVEDDGPGISDDFKGRIFHRMLRGTTKAKGMGLGLYLVKSLVESYGGRVWVEDRVVGDHTKGARFVVMLPSVEK